MNEHDPPDRRPDDAQPTPSHHAHAKPHHPMQPWQVILHSDDENVPAHVVESVIHLTTLGREQARHTVGRANREGVSLLLTTHRERAELYQQQFGTRNVTVTIRPQTN